jgi:hypothetical protein
LQAFSFELILVLKQIPILTNIVIKLILSKVVLVYAERT